MGLLDSVAGIMGVFAVNYINNAAMIVLLQQAAIPISMSISKMFLGATYTVSQVRKDACGGGRLPKVHNGHACHGFVCPQRSHRCKGSGQRMPA